MLTGAKTKKRNRLALPRQKVSRNTPNGGLPESRALKQVSETHVKADGYRGTSGGTCCRANAVVGAAEPSGTSSGLLASTHTTTAVSGLSSGANFQDATTGRSMQGLGKETAWNNTAVEQTAGCRSAVTGSSGKFKQQEGNEEIVKHQEERVAEDEDEIVHTDASKSIREPLQAVNLNQATLDTTAGATKQHVSSVVAAAASEAILVLDRLEHGEHHDCHNSSGGDNGTNETQAPPLTPVLGSKENNRTQLRAGVSAGTADPRTDIQQHTRQDRQPSCPKRRRPVTTATPPGASSPERLVLPPARASTPPLPSTARKGRSNSISISISNSNSNRNEDLSEAASTSTAVVQAKAQAAAVAVEVVLSDDDGEIQPPGPVNFEGQGGGGTSETSSFATPRPPGSPFTKEDGAPPPPSSTSSEKREHCPVCSSAVWGLDFRARQVHINSCLDGLNRTTSGAVAGGAVSWRDGRRNGEAGAAPSRRQTLSTASASALAKEPKTEYQEHLQMAKALSKSLVVPARSSEAMTAAAEEEEEDQTEEELLRNPKAFRAKEKRLLRTLNDLDAKLERLTKDRDSALRKLAAHRTLGARFSAWAGGGVSDEGGSGGAPSMTAKEVVDIMFPGEHADTGGGGGSGVPFPTTTWKTRPPTRSEGRCALTGKEDATAAAGGGGGGGDVGVAATDVDAHTDTSSVPPDMARRRSGHSEIRSCGGISEESAGVVHWADASARGASLSPAKGVGGGEHSSGGNGDGDDDAGGGAARLRRRRSSGFGSVSGGEGGRGGGSSLDENGQPLSSSARGNGGRRSGRTLWGIAQGADELSQSNFVTGVFAEIRGKHTATGPSSLTTRAATRAGKTRSADVSCRRRTAMVVTAAAYSNACLYNSRTISARAAASPSSMSASLDGCAEVDSGAPSFAAAAAATATAALSGDDDIQARKYAEESSVPRAPEMDTFDDDAGDSGGGSDDGNGDDPVDAVDSTILLLSQTLSAGNHPCSSPAAPVSRRREGPPPPETPRASGASSAREGPQEGEGEREEEEGSEAARVVARHIGRAPVAALSGLFPNWKENVRFVFQQSVVDLREALQSISAALSQEEATVTAGAARTTGEGFVLDGGHGREDRRQGVRGTGKPFGEGNTGSDGVGRGGSSGKCGGKVEALLFFQGVILEALELKGTVGGPRRDTLAFPKREDEPEDETSRSSSGAGRHDEMGAPHRWSASGDGIRNCGGGEGDIANGDAHPGVKSPPCEGFVGQGNEYAREEKGKTRKCSSGDGHQNDGRHASGKEDDAAATEFPGGAIGNDGTGGRDQDEDATVHVGSEADGDPKEEQEGRCDDLATVAHCSVIEGKGKDEADDDLAIVADGGTVEEEGDDEKGEGGNDFDTVTGGDGGGTIEEESEDGDFSFNIFPNGDGGATERLGASDAGGVDGGGTDADSAADEYSAEPDFMGDYWRWDENGVDENGVVSLLRSRDKDTNDDDEESGLLSQPPSPTQRTLASPSTQIHDAGAAGDSGVGDNSYCCGDESFLDTGADLLDLTQVAPSPVPPPPQPPPPLSSSRHDSPGGRSESAPEATTPGRSLSVHGGVTQRSTVRRDNDSHAATLLEEQQENAEHGEQDERAEEEMARPASCAQSGGVEDEDALPEIMPSFSQLTLQELSCLMAVYGLKKKSKREMAERLEQIWKALHPGGVVAETDLLPKTAERGYASAVGLSGRGRGEGASSSRDRDCGGVELSLSALSQERGLRAGTSKTVSISSKSAAVRTGTTRTGGLRGRPPRAKPPRPSLCRTRGPGGPSHEGAAVPAAEGQEGQEEVEELAPWSASSPGLASSVPQQQQQQQQQRPVGRKGSDGSGDGEVPLGERIRAVISGYAPLHEDILLFKTVELTATQHLLKNAGLKCSKKDLASYLDARGITFVDRGAKRRGGEGRGDGGARPPRKKVRAAGGGGGGFGGGGGGGGSTSSLR